MSTQRVRPIEQYFPTEPWLEQYRRAINESDDYAARSAGWGVDFDGSFVFQIEDVPLETTTLAGLPPEIVDAIEDEFSDRSADAIEPIVEAAPADVRERIDAREGALEDRLTAELCRTTIADLPARTWPELLAAVPDIFEDLTVQATENVVDGTVYSYLDLYDGECRGVEVLTEPDEHEYGFRLAGEYETWTKLVRGDGGIVDMLMAGELELDGDIQRLLQYSDAAVGLADVAADVDSRFLF
ncbi:SCP2 sterol-binding domain-containing protein [Natrinema longum]|uniref:SCP2 sterol-binding domain-containing protein n=1 Tax=Natrinema longum TaxID=370324 RepID=A0A8A2U6M6_9EURY|nr:SCP2 sterol-binding domain-containing protein [Natrinema longum]MBZ6494327.1 SCP2 sterol-binding domain-containing protein [Natrinema longum]QSW84350.1 SCP2 sterol-binding domain-containing protein [Natrinema longum]